MGLSRAFIDADEQTPTQQHILCVLGLLLPPVPIYIMSGPHYTCRTKEFWISVLLMFVFYFGAWIHMIWFIYIGFPNGRQQSYERLDTDPEAAATPAENAQLRSERPAGQRPERPSEAPPIYEDVARSSNGKVENPPLGDNKVQRD